MATDAHRPVRVLVTGAGALLGQGVIRSLLNARAASFEVIAADPSPLSAGLYWANERYLIPKAADPCFIRSVETVIAKTRPDLVIPGTDVELMALARERHRLEREYKTHVLVSAPEVIRIADDKYETFEFFQSHGFSPPDSCLPGAEASLVDRVGFPLVVKPRIGARSVGVRLVRNEVELAEAIRSTHAPVIQECVGDDDGEYTAGVVYFDDDNCASIVMRRDLRDGNTYRGYVDAYPELNAQMVEFARALRPYGPANFQFRLRGGRASVFEINARFSGTTPFRMHAGFNEVQMCVDHVLHGQPVRQPLVSAMTVLRYFAEMAIPTGGLLSSGS